MTVEQQTQADDTEVLLFSDGTILLDREDPLADSPHITAVEAVALMEVLCN